MNSITLSAAHEQRKADRAMEIRTYQEGDPTRRKPTREAGRITVTVGGVEYVLMEGPNKRELYAVYVEKDAFYIEFVLPGDASTILLPA